MTTFTEINMVNKLPVILNSTSEVPIVIAACGQSNMVGWTLANNGPRFAFPETFIWDTGTESFRPANTLTEYTVYCGNPALSIKTIGAGRNNPAFGFAYRLQRETGRPVYIIYNATGGRNSLYWIGNGRNSVDWVALNSDLENALASIGVTKIDYFLWQQGEADADDGSPAGKYTAALDTLQLQAKAEGWWQTGQTRMIIGRPCSQWTATTELAYLNSEITNFSALNRAYVHVAATDSLMFSGGIYPAGDPVGDSIHYSGRSLYSLGYYNYWESLPVKPAGTRDQAAQSLIQKEPETPWPAGLYVTPDPVPNYQTQTRRPPLYNLEPTVTITGNRMWVFYTSNATTAGEGGGQFAKGSYTDLVGGLPTGTWQGQSSSVAGAVDFIGSEACCPKAWVAPDGALHVFMLGSNNGDVWDGLGGIWHTMCRFPEAQFPRFTQPRKISEYGVPNRPFRLGAKWYLPVSYWRLTNGGGNASFVPGIAGRWYYEWDWVNCTIKRAFAGASETTNNTYDEQCLHLLQDGRVRASWRTLNGAYISDNATNDLNNPAAWTTPVAWASLGTNPASRHCVINTPTGRAAIAYNFSATRTNLRLGLSNSTNTNIVNYNIILQAGASAYPDIHISGDNIFTAYDAGGDRAATRLIRIAHVLESAMIAGTATVTTYTVDTGS